MKLKLTTFQIGTAPIRGQGLRIGVTRRPPRGVPKADWTKEGYFDVWLPVVAPSRKLLARFKTKDWDDASIRESFFESYEAELEANTEARQTVDLLAEMAERIPVSIGCYCGDEARCHRSKLYQLIMQRAKG